MSWHDIFLWSVSMDQGTLKILSRVSTLQVRSKSAIAYYQSELNYQGKSSLFQNQSSSYNHSKKFLENVEKLKTSEKYSGMMTYGSKKRLTKAVSLLVQSSPFKWIHNPVNDKMVHHRLSFITLTLPDVEKAKDASFCHKHCLQPMLRILRNKYKMKSYVWKCELQKNGSIHYHITTELFIVHTDLKNTWNNITRNLGLLDDFKKQYGHDSPNSTDIHSVQNINDLEAYLVKYIAKSYQNEKKLDGKVWDCSKNLKASKYYSTPTSYSINRSIMAEVDSGHASIVYADKCIIFKFKTTDWINVLSDHIVKDYYSHLKSISEWKPPVKSTTMSSTTQSLNELITSSPCGVFGRTTPASKCITALPPQLPLFQMSCSGNTFTPG